MNITRILTCCLAVAVPAAIGRSHGVSISLDTLNNKVTVANGIADATGYAPMIFADGSVDALLLHEDVPAFGNVAHTELPAFVLQGMAEHSIISLEIIPRPVQGTDPVEERLLWHWSAATQTVGLAPNGESLVVASEFQQFTIPQTGTPPFPLFVTLLEPFFIGEHIHYLRYLLDDSPSAVPGAYGFFARFLVAPYENSDPLLIVLNNGLDESALLTAALAINAAAADPVLAGDYNGDAAVDAADYLVWRDTFGSTSELAADGSGNLVIDDADYGIWRANFGAAASGVAANSPHMRATSVPEPASVIFAACAILSVLAKLAKFN